MTQTKRTIGPCEMWLGNCMDVLPTLGKVDAVVTDPPYGIGFVKGTGGGGVPAKRNHGAIHGDDAPFDPSPFLSWPCVIFGGNHFYARLSDGGTFHVWDKAYGTTLDDSFSDAEFVWTSWRCASEVFRYLWKGVLQQGEKGLPKYHVSQKPIEVMRWALRFVPSADIILDPYMGSGSTLIACVKENRRGIGIEIDERNYEIACKRIERAMDEQALFTGGVQ